MVIMLRTISNLGTPEEKVEDTPIIDVHLDDRSSVPAIIYHWDEFPNGCTWDRIGDTWKIDKDGHRTTRTILVIDDKEYDEAQVKEHYAELKVLFDRMHTEKLLQEIDDDQSGFEGI
ncbi:MAG: hypothetical protein II983_06145 [Firmicutes bacterium]|nr:hypothetical protein [Methanobrevibacter sp.]MBQ4505238.1 hypothetical protein [Bacillota bacterium]MBR0371640.1 hypothetical protein [Methanobrevibacter sp.]